MLRRKKIVDAEASERQRAEAEQAEADLAREREKVQSTNAAIMGEIREHRRLLRENNFVLRIQRVLGGAEG